MYQFLSNLKSIEKFDTSFDISLIYNLISSIENSMTQKISDLQAKYIKDADLMANKSRFGFFTLYPSHTAGKTDFSQKKAHKDQNGKVVNDVRGIYSGSKSAKVLNRTLFSQMKSAFIGCPYQDLKAKKQKIQQYKKLNQGKQIFKPARLQKTLTCSAYAYNPTRQKIIPKKYRDESGRVITKPPNICSNSLYKLQHQNEKTFKYKQDPYDNAKNKRKQELELDLKMRGESFKTGNTGKPYFNNNKVVFGGNTIGNQDQVIHGQKEKRNKSKSLSNIGYKHQANFRPSSGKLTKYNGLFNKITYKQQGQLKQRPQSANKLNAKAQSLKTMTKVYQTRPCPSVTLNKINLMRSIR